MKRLRVPVAALAVGWGVVAAPRVAAEADENLVRVDLATPTDGTTPPAGLELSGDATFGPLGDGRREIAGRGIRLVAGEDVNGDGTHEGVVTAMVGNVGPGHGRWFRFRIRGLAQDGFTVDANDLFLEVEFFRDGGTDPLDSVKQEIYPLVERDRAALADAGTNKNLGCATWRSFDMVFRTPFPEVDTLRLGVGFGHGRADGPRAEFQVSEIDLRPIPVPAGYVAPEAPAAGRPKADAAGMVPLGGRWYFDPRGGDRTPPAEFTAANAGQLFYLSDRLECPFADSMSAWLRKG